MIMEIRARLYPHHHYHHQSSSPYKEDTRPFISLASTCNIFPVSFLGKARDCHVFCSLQLVPPRHKHSLINKNLPGLSHACKLLKNNSFLEPMFSLPVQVILAENIPSDSSNRSHCCSASYAMLSNGIHEDSCQFSDLAQLLVRARNSSPMLPLAACQENSVKKGTTQQSFPVRTEHPLSLAKSSSGRPDCNVQPYVLPPIPEHEAEEPVVAYSESSKTILVRESSLLDLIKHSSLPAELLLRLPNDEPNQRSFNSVRSYHAMAVEGPPQASSIVASSGSELKSNELRRKNSCPGGFLPPFSTNPTSNTLMAEKSTSQDVINRRGSSESGNFILDSVIKKNSLIKRGRKAESQMIKVEPQANDSWHTIQGQIESGEYTVARTLMTDNMPVDVVLCKSRAKRGCATHPRSIAERIRRTKISERMKKLYDLLPNMDKQVRTADMLDEVVEYVKQLQRQVQELSENINQCRMCQTKEQPF